MSEDTPNSDSLRKSIFKRLNESGASASLKNSLNQMREGIVHKVSDLKTKTNWAEKDPGYSVGVREFDDNGFAKYNIDGDEIFISKISDHVNFDEEFDFKMVRATDEFVGASVSAEIPEIPEETAGPVNPRELFGNIAVGTPIQTVFDGYVGINDNGVIRNVSNQPRMVEETEPLIGSDQAEELFAYDENLPELGLFGSEETEDVAEESVVTDAVEEIAEESAVKEEVETPEWFSVEKVAEDVAEESDEWMGVSAEDIEEPEWLSIDEETEEESVVMDVMEEIEEESVATEEVETPEWLSVEEVAEDVAVESTAEEESEEEIVATPSIPKAVVPEGLYVENDAPSSDAVSVSAAATAPTAVAVATSSVAVSPSVCLIDREGERSTFTDPQVRRPRSSQRFRFTNGVLTNVPVSESEEGLRRPLE